MSNLAKLEDVLVNGDLQSLNPMDRVMYYKKVCESVGLNPLTKPFEYIRLNGKLTLYARRDATDQLRSIHGISIKITARDKHEDIYVVTAQASNKDGRCDESVGAVSLAGLKGEALANAIMKCETKAKRRATLSIAGLGLLDENETTTIPNAQRVKLDLDTGEIIEEPKALSAPMAVNDPLVLMQLADDLNYLYDNKDEANLIKVVSEMSGDQKKQVWEALEKPVKSWIKEALSANA